MLILAGVTINMVLGDDGIIQNAQQASQKHNGKSEMELVQLAVSTARVDELAGKTDGKTIQEALDELFGERKAIYDEEKEEIKVGEITYKIDANGKVTKDTISVETENPYIASYTDDGVPIPTGFEYIEGTKDEGVVISDDDGNEFVWVPVDDFSKFAKAANTGVEGDYQGILYDVNSDGTMQEKIDYGQGTTEYREPANLSTTYDNTTNLAEWTADLFQDEYNKMAESVKKYKGFYVGRYETGGFNSTKVVSKAGENQASCIGIDWYIMYSMQKALYGENASVTSGMIYGAQWDAIMLWMKDVPNVTDSSKKYIKDSTDMGNYCELCPSCNGDECDDCEWLGYQEATPIETGSNPEYSVKNIFDLAGNYWEWTQEADDDCSRVLRGGCYFDLGSDNPASIRGDGIPDSGCDHYSSRLQLYIK